MVRRGSAAGGILRCVQSVQGGIHGQAVARRTQPQDHAFGEVREIGVVAEGLAPVDVGQVHFDEGQGNARKGIAQGHAGVREGARADDDELGAVGARGLHAVDQHAFVVALEGAQRGAAAGGVGDQIGVDLLQGGGAIDLRFADAQQVEVGAMEGKQLHGSTEGPAGKFLRCGSGRCPSG